MRESVRMHTGKRSFFTLIELLVTVSILVLLMSILLPALSRAKATANQIKCLNNLKQTGTAANMYIMDNLETLPNCETCSWDRLFAPYIHAAADPWPGYTGAYGYDTV